MSPSPRQPTRRRPKHGPSPAAFPPVLVRSLFWAPCHDGFGLPSFDRPLSRPLLSADVGMAPNGPHHDSKGLISFLQRRQPSSPRTTAALEGRVDASMALGRFAHANSPPALGELQQNRQQSPPKPREPVVPPWAAISLKPVADRDSLKPVGTGKGSDEPVNGPRDALSSSSPSKPKKTKSSTNLVGLLSRPKSLKNLYKLASDDELAVARDKENRKPDEPATTGGGVTPIFAHFTSDPAAARQKPSSEDHRRPAEAVKERPRSLHVPRMASGPMRTVVHTEKPSSTASSSSVVYPEHILNPHDINRQLEDLLDRRNIPENQRYKMRNLNDTIKTEFIRQDWAEMQAARGGSDSVRGPDPAHAPGPTSGPASVTPAGSDCDEERPKRRGRGRSFTFSRGKKESRPSSKKPKSDGTTLGRHLRSKSTESVAATERPLSVVPSAGTSLLSKMKLQQGPGDYVAYLAKVQKPELVEVGRLHKLRLLLRNETVAWIEDFIQQDGMEQIVGLLHRIMAVEWREEHEDALLHENLLCLKALATTARAIEYLDSVQARLFPKLLHLLFDPDKKGPSEFTTRNIITSVLLTYIESAVPAERVGRAELVLAHLRDKEPSEAERPVPFVLEMRQARPYRVWCKEVVSVTKEVFWIFLHNLNVVALPPAPASDNEDDRTAYGYMLRHFPPERPPVPAAPYVGGVEWDATNYLASHLDLMNAILASTPSSKERNALRADLRVSGWERCLGGSLRLCKEKFYGAIHVALRTWVAAAVEDGWDVRDVRFGPSPEARHSPVKAGGGGLKIKTDEAPPKLAIPNLDSEAGQPGEGWL
ncbi:hypothetical protein XA68_16829 [Ophiocordyceps unilateralis]|uniref:Formin GTPase-binding domain-containing protein n=1 Tax=Ophiocordyceps unilateralis TaxID=268505 RepID=A0A2A9P445_OPHUN|nr:hypothetical protein XA68_16829 [Ophiocordyceps unilateralis]